MSVIDLLITLNFSKNQVGSYVKYYNDYCICVDLANNKILYQDDRKDKTRQISIDEETTSNLNAQENMVVLECVNRLLEKGYRPEDLTLEKRWQLGHGASGGRADIYVAKANPDSGEKEGLFIIECKTWGTEFKSARRDTLENGGQLFSYYQQDQSLQYLCLYTSRYNENDKSVEYINDIIKVTDDKNIEIAAEKDKTILLYKNARKVEELFAVWDETYHKYIHPDLIFIPDAKPYTPEVIPLKKKHLKEFQQDDCGYLHNQFAEILRHNNISDKENAFNKLISLFLCKVVDEQKKSDEDIVEFQYKEGSDTYEDLQDRLQQLYKRGMEEYLREEIFYIEKDYANKILQQHTGSRRKFLEKELNETIRKLKFYTNNEFAFKEVHNEELFLQNGKVLVEVVQLLEQYRIAYTQKHQFLGNLFELLLNDGFKQSEGQFFTPIPIARFIWNSLPLEKILGRIDKKENGAVFKFPRIIDYACGAGHFLSEGVDAINDYMRQLDPELMKTNSSWVGNCIYGVERDYRLARVSKIALFLNGAGYGNIVFGDGLEHYDDRLGKPESFDILVSNPPYSVKSFKQHLKLKNNDFEILPSLGENSSEIESLFVERIAQLLKPEGVAAVLLPSSILSNSSACYTAAREILLKNFKIRCITELGGKTFIATGTNTIVLFLEKFSEPPKQKEVKKDVVEAILGSSTLSEWEDQPIFEAFLQRIDVTAETYRAFISKVPLDELAQNPYFKQYVDWFEGYSEIKTLKGKKFFKALSEDEQQKRLQDEFYKEVMDKEREKLYYFSLVYGQKTLIIKAPQDNNEQKQFLGYEWSSRRGAEGLQVIKDGGMLYDPANRNAENSLAMRVKKSFLDQKPFLDEMKDFIWTVNLSDIVDFTRIDFFKLISTSNRPKEKTIKYKYPLRKFFTAIGSLEYGKALPSEQRVNGPYPVIGSNGADGTHDTYLIEAPAIVIGRKGSAGKITWVEKNCWPIDTTFYLRYSSDIIPKFAYHLCVSLDLGQYNTGIGVPGLNRNTVHELDVPLLPPDIQKQIVTEIEAVDEDIKSYEDKGKIIKEQILNIITKQASTETIKTICQISSEGINPSLDSDKEFNNVGLEHIESNTGQLINWRPSKGENIKSNKNVFHKGELLYGKLRPYLNKV